MSTLTYSMPTMVRALRVLAQAEHDGRILTAMEMAERADLSPNSGPALRRDLVETGLLEIVRQAYSNQPAIVRVTDAGWAAIGGEPQRPAKPKARQRKCLSCSGEFYSLGPGNRVCEPCKRTPVWRDGSDPSAVAL